MQKVILFRGLPGSGKSYQARQIVEKDPSFVRINRDDLRNMRGKYWLPKQEDLITDWQKSLVSIALTNGKNVVIDDTNLNPKIFQSWLDFFVNVEIEVIDLRKVDVNLCIQRDLQRANSVGEPVIRRMYYQYILGATKVEQDPKLPHAIICDLDGTLALFKEEGKNAYERDFINDRINIPVKMIIENYLKDDNKYLIITSARSDRFWEETTRWLVNNGIAFDKMFMRPVEDEKRGIHDNVIKLRMFNENIKDKYYIDFVLDDRNQVVELWRSLGLTCLQVADGAF